MSGQTAQPLEDCDDDGKTVSSIIHHHPPLDRSVPVSSHAYETMLLVYVHLHGDTLRVLSHLVRLPGPNPSWIAPPSPCPRWTAFILFYLGLNRGSFALSSQQLFTPLLSNDGAGDGGKMHKIALCTFIYLRFWTVHFEPNPRPPFLSGLGYGSLVRTRGRKTAFTSSKRTELWRQSNTGAHQKC